MTTGSAADAMFRRGLDAYHAGLHYEAHEHWEELWNDEEGDDDDRRRFLQALIQVASAVHKLVNNVEPRGSVRLLRRAQTLLEGLPDDFGGVRVDRLRGGIERCLAEAERLVAAGRAGLAPSLIPPIQMQPPHAAHPRDPG